MDSLSEGSSFKTALMSELLPAPEGAVMTNSLPLPLLNVLHLFAHLLDQQLQFERAIGDLRAGGLGGERVRLAVQFLREEVEALARRTAVPQHAIDFRKVYGQPLELLVDVALAREHGDFRTDALVVGRTKRFLQPLRKLRLIRH